MQLSQQQTLPVNQQQAWDALNDTELLKLAIPGCESLTANGEHAYDVRVTAAVGPVKAKFKGSLRLDELNPPNSYVMHFEAQGGAAGHGKGKAQVRLEAKGPHETVLHYTVDASVGGKIAQIGSRIVDMAAQKTANDFFARFNAELAQRYGVAPVAEAKAGGGLFARFLAWLRKLFGG